MQNNLHIKTFFIFYNFILEQTCKTVQEISLQTKTKNNNKGTLKIADDCKGQPKL